MAARPGIAMTAILMAQGHAEIEARAAGVHDHWVGSEGFTFRGRDDADRLGDVVKLHGRRSPGRMSAVGLSFLVLTACGRIERDYTFLVA